MASMLSTLPITLILISALMIFALRSWRLGVISLVPNIAPAVIGFGLWALISGEINLGLSVVVTLTLGIVVDDAVHSMSQFRLNSDMGQLSAIVIFVALVIDFVLLPSLLMRFDTAEYAQLEKLSRAEHNTHSTESSVIRTSR